MLRWVAAALLVLAAAGLLWSVRTREPPESRYRLALQCLRDGDFDGAALEAASGERNSNAPYWRSRFQLLRVEALIESGRGEDALKLLNSKRDLESAESNVRERVLRARLLVAKADLQSAQTLLSEARRIAVEDRRSDLRAEAELLFGQTLGRQGRLEQAEASFHAASTAAIGAGDLYRQGAAINNLGMVQMIRSRCEEAIPLFEQAQNLYREAGANHWVAAARNNIGLCYSQLGDLGKAFTYRQAALALSRPSALKANALGETGTVLLVDDPLKAIPLYRQARDMARGFGSHSDAARWAGNLASALAATRDWDAADAALQEARQLGPEARSAAFLNLNAASIALGRGRPGEARAIYLAAIASSAGNPAVLWQAHAGIAASHLSSGHPEEAIQSFEAATRLIEDTQSDLNRNEHKLTFLARLIRFYQDYVDLLVTRNEPVRALAVADRSRARILSARLAQSINKKAGLSGEELRSIAKASGSVWLAYWIAPKRSFLWVVTPNVVRVFNLPGQEDIAHLVKEYRAFVEVAMRDPLQTASEAGEKLYEILIGPAASLLPPGSKVIVVPNGPLHQLSFDTLPVYSTGQPHYFLDDATVSVAPSFGIYGGGSSPAVAGRDALIIGDPVSPSPAFPDLKYAGREIASVASRMTSDRTVIMKGSAARPEVWETANPGSFSIIHIAAHAEANENSPLDSAIILSPGNRYRLYARDVIDVHLKADLVTLSACRSSGARVYPGEGMVGFAWAFLHAGARSVVAGLWDVADESTTMLTEHLYTALAAGKPPAEALRQARLLMRQTAYAKPYYWGAFQCYTR